ncbi:MAG: chloride channel protein, partial [Moorella sp. (in: Bacteria)]|nr:chloride channel protein [Moorella sp. (in: firmicutes)]
ILSYSAGVPGGIFLPLLVLGALLGSLVGQAGELFFPVLRGTEAAFVVVGMAACFVAIVRAPLTGIVLIIEMTGNYLPMVPLLMTSVIAYLVAETLGSLPVYEMLLERDLTKGKSEQTSNLTQPSEDRMLAVEFAVEGGAGACGCRVKDLALPPDCLLVTVNRGSREIIPRGNTRLLEGDLLTFIVPESKAASVLEELSRVTCCRLRE